MNSLIKIIIIMALFFASTFLVVKSSGVLTAAQIEGWLTAAGNASPVYVGGLIALLLFADLFVAVPTLTVTILAGYFLGQMHGSMAALCGLMMAGVTGYGLSRIFGARILCFLMRDEYRRTEARAAFRQHGFVMILLSRAMPILPEITACMAGMTGMKFSRFLLAWSLSSVPYALIASYAGSISSLSNPAPAIFTALAISGGLWLAWFAFQRRHKRGL